jgi:hypothetical protein
MNFAAILAKLSTEVDFSRFDGTEVSPCVRLDSAGKPRRHDETIPAGEIWNYEACDADDPHIACWTVYGHLAEGGVECLSDFTGDDARANAEAFAAFVESRFGFAVAS